MNNQKINNRICHFCHSEEGKLRLIGNFMVQLKQVDVLGTQKLACQSCYRKTVRIINNEHKTPKIMNSIIKSKFQKIAFKLYGLFLMCILFSLEVVAQGPPGLPGFPSSPDPAPIDGGLGLLAAAGGAYAFKKLRDKRKGEEELE